MPEEQLAIPPGTPEADRRYLMLEAARERGWLDFTSTNPEGYVDEQGVTHQCKTYSISLGDGRIRLVLAAYEVEGFVYGLAVELGEVEAIAYRPGMVPAVDPLETDEE